MIDRRALLRRLGWVLALILVIQVAGFVGNASAAIVGIEIASLSSASNSVDKGVTATCPAGKKVVGAGADVTPGNGDVLIDDIRPNASLTSVRVNAVEDEDGTSTNWFVAAYAICAVAPGGLQRVSATSATDSSNKSVSATCPAGKQVLGTGMEIIGASRQILVREIRPFAGFVRVGAIEDETGTTKSWSVTAYAMCADPVAGLARGESTGPIPFDSSTSKVQTHPCSGGHLLGVGGTLNSPNGQLVLDALFPDAALTTGGVAAWEDDTRNTENWSLTVFVICAATSERDVGSNVPPTGFDLTFADGVCPDDKLLTGMGADIVGGLGQVSVSYEPISGTTTRAVAWEDEDDTNNNWSARSFAICTTELTGLEVVSRTSDIGSFPVQFVAAPCPAGKVVLGGAGFANTTDGHFARDQLFIQGIVPRASNDVLVTVAEDGTGLGVEWQVIAYAICALPVAGHTVVTTSRTFEADTDFASVTSTCPAGKHVLGTGVLVDVKPGRLIVDEVRPNAALTAVTVSAIASQSWTPSTDWSLTAYAICAAG
jgi:hypothetical protein